MARFLHRANRSLLLSPRLKQKPLIRLKYEKVCGASDKELIGHKTNPDRKLQQPKTDVRQENEIAV